MNLEKIMLGISVLIFMITFYFFMLVIIPVDPIHFEEGLAPVKIINEGSATYIDVQFNYCKNADYDVDIYTYFANDLVYRVDSQTTLLLPSGCRSITYRQYVSKHLPLGEYHIDYVFEYTINPLKTINKLVRTQEFLLE